MTNDWTFYGSDRNRTEVVLLETRKEVDFQVIKDEVFLIVENDTDRVQVVFDRNTFSKLVERLVDMKKTLDNESEI